MISKSEQKFIKSLKVKKYRMREKRFLVEGTKNVNELLKSNFKIDLLLGTSDFFSSNSLELKIRTEEAKSNLLEQLGTFKSNSSCLAVVHSKEDSEVRIPSKEALFVLDGVGDPGNMGTIIRTLDWFGYTHLVCSQDCAEFYHPKVIASTMGSFTRMNVNYVNLEEFLKDVSLPIYSADMNGSDLYTTKIKSPAIMIMGSESNGISEGAKKFVSDYISIPKFGDAESLNVGVATGIIAGHLRIS